MAFLTTANEARGHFYLYFVKKTHNEEASNARLGEIKYCRYRERVENIYIEQSQILNQIYLQEISMNLKFCTARAGSCPVTFKENFLSKVLTAVEL